MAAAPYLGTVLLARWLPAVALVAGGVIVLAALTHGWRRSGRPRTAPFVLALGMPLHLLILTTGNLGSPLLPLLAPWLFMIGRLWPRQRLVLFGGSTLSWVYLISVWRGALSPFGALEALLVVVGGIAPAWLPGWKARRGGARVEEPAVGERAEGALTEVAYQPRFEIGPMLERLCQVLGARRAVLWDIDVLEDIAYPRVASGGAAPLAVPLTGDPIRWAWEEALSLRLETPPRWASGGARACVVPLEPGGHAAAVLTLEYDSEVPFPGAQVLEEGATQLRAFLAMQQETARAVMTRERFGAVADLLRRLPLEQEPARFARELASAAVRLVGASGGAVAIWEEEVGRILAVVGEDGGPHMDAVFGPMECEMAVAASTAATVWRQRGRGEGSRLPIGAPGERWHAEPRSVTLLPLIDPVSGVVGVLALWNAAPMPIDREGVEVLEMVAPYAAMQLQQTRLYAPLREYAERDALTRLHNRRIFEERLEKEEAHFHRYHRPVSLLVLDVDHFKRINDTLGHEAGDSVLRTLGHLLQGTVRAADLAARLGGEEFVVLLPETSLAGALEIAERLRRQVEGHAFEWQGSTIPVRISVGVSACPECTPLPSTLLGSADAALYASKHGGRNRVTAAPFAAVDPR